MHNVGEVQFFLEFPVFILFRHGVPCIATINNCNTLLLFTDADLARAYVERGIREGTGGLYGDETVQELTADEFRTFAGTMLSLGYKYLTVDPPGPAPSGLRGAMIQDFLDDLGRHR